MLRIVPLTLMLALFCSSVFSQQQLQKTLPKLKTKERTFSATEAPFSKTKNGGSQLLSAGDTILYEDFASGIPSTWTNTGSSSSFEWAYTTTGPATLSGYGLKSTSKSNGWAMIDAYGLTLGSGTSTLQSPAIDCSTRPSVLLQFQEYFYQLNGALTTVEVSTDGTNWTQYIVNADFSGNQVTANPETVTLNLTDIAAGQATVYIRFVWDNSAGSLNVFWQIDDILLVEAEDNDLALTDIFTSTDFFFADYYGITPLNEALGFYYTCRAVNNGATTQTNVTLNNNTELNAVSVYSEVSTPIDMQAAEVDTFDLSANAFVPSETGDYTTTFWLDQSETDVDTTDNYLSFDYSISDTVFARDNGSYNGYMGPASYGNTEIEVGTLYYLPVDAEMTSASMYVGQGSKTNSAFYFNVYEVDPTDLTVNLIYTSDIFTLTSNSQAKKWQTVSFGGDPQFLPAGLYCLTAYLIDADPNNNGMFIGTNLPSFLPNGLFNSFIFEAGEIKYWFGNSTPMLRMNFGGLAGVRETKSPMASLYQNIPNPSNGITSISYTLKETAKNVSLDVMDITGKVVMTVPQGSKAIGNQIINLDATSLSAGTYFYTLNVDGAKLTSKMTITK